MTESELCGSSFDWEGGSPSVFFRPMNPALSSQHYFPEDSPVILEEKEGWRRNGILLTPASPLFGSISYMSQESSCCSALNNAVIMDDDDTETIPTDERPSLIPVGAPDDVSPIVEKSFNVSDLPVANVTIPLASQSVNSSSLQELLYNAPPVGSSPGPQWSPGIRSGAPLLKSPNPPLIRIENFLDASPSISPKKMKPLDSSLSISAILPSAVETPAEEPEEGPITTNHRELQERKFLEPSPVRRFTHHRSSFQGAEDIPITRNRSSFQGTKIPVRRPVEYEEYRKIPSRVYEQRQPATARRTVLSSEERQLREAEEGRKRLLNQIRRNRIGLEHSRLDDSFRRTSFLDRTCSPVPVRSVRSESPTIGLKSRLDTSRGSLMLRTSSLDRSSFTYRPGVKVELYSHPAPVVRTAARTSAALYTTHRRTGTTTTRPAWR